MVRMVGLINNIRDIEKSLNYKPLNRGDSFKEIVDDFYEQIRDCTDSGSGTENKRYYNYIAVKRELAKRYLQYDGPWNEHLDTQMTLNHLSTTRTARVLKCIANIAGFSRTEFLALLADTHFRDEAVWAAVQEVQSDSAMDVGMFAAMHFNAIKKKGELQDREISSRHPE